MHPSADVRGTAINLIRGAFEYQGQKCSACSRAYIPESRWPEVERILKEEVPKVPMGRGGRSQEPDGGDHRRSGVHEHRSATSSSPAATRRTTRSWSAGSPTARRAGSSVPP